MRNSNCCHYHLYKQSLLSPVLATRISHIEASLQALDECLGQQLDHLEELVWELPEAHKVDGEAYHYNLYNSK